MKFSVATIAAFAAVALARPKFTNNSYQGISEGEPFTLTWDSAKGAVTIELFTGTDPNNLKPVRVLTTTTGASGSFTFTPSNLPTGPYAFRISDESGDAPNFSESFDYSGTAVSASITSSASASRTSTSSAASSTQTETETETETESQTSTSTASGSTTTSATHSTTTTFSTRTSSTSSTRTPSPTAPPPTNTNNGQRFGSSLALVLGTAIALIFFN